MREVFVVTSTDPDYELYTEVYILDSLGKANAKLTDLTYGSTDDDSVQVYHGILLNADCIPPTFNGCTPYIIVQNPERTKSKAVENEAHFEKMVINPNKVAEKIEDLLESENLFISIDGSEMNVTIDDIYLFFGYNMIKVLQISEERVDDEIMSRLYKIDSAVAKVKNGLNGAT